MAKATDHVRISPSNKERLRARARKGESFDDVIGRLLDNDDAAFSPGDHTQKDAPVGTK